ncbi:hypothetical protein A4X13_0g184 [Tilletia indica]|uniref:Uncharacterized protein n=1 Tax=Tilletia indica TaxID=43049 RepID=A0A177TUN0_9BASI|nr:hypothetical protein A4X13_0g184 [Tilletia indica]
MNNSTVASFRIHLTLFRSQSSEAADQRILPTSLFHRLPAHSSNNDELSTDDALTLRIRKEQVDVDQRFGPITLDWADNETLFEISMQSRNAHSRPPHVRTPSHLQQPTQLPHDTAGAAAYRSAQVVASASASASGSASAGTSAPTPSTTRNVPTVTTAAAESPVPVARYTQQSTFSADLDQNAGPDRSAAESAQASASSYSIGRTHVSFGIVHLFRDQSEADQAASTEQDSKFPALSTNSQPPASTIATSSKTHISSSSSSSPPAGAVQVTTDEEAGSILGILAVPTYMTAADFLAFIEPAADAISHIRMIRELQTEKCMVLIKFRDPFDAEEFHKMYNGQPFNAINEDELCQVVYITSVTVSSSYTLPHAYPLLANSDPWPMLPPSSSSSTSTTSAPLTNSPNASGGAAGSSTSGRLAAHLNYELPTCPVCLERMDSNVTGLMTVTCQHTFHCACLSKWIDSRCPVCRYSQTRQRNGAAGSSLGSAQSRCTICTTATDLWVCLICASVGCGRYKAGHAQQHFQETGHLYSLELETQRVWDYAGDGYVHRLIQNKADGKLVELPSGSSAASTPARGGQRVLRSGAGGADMDDVSFSGGNGKGSSHRLMLGGMGSGSSDPEDKVESLGLEYSYLIASQLESQRSFYEEQVRLLQTQLESSQLAHTQTRESLSQTEADLATIKTRLSEMELINDRLNTERERSDKRAEKALELMRKHERDLHTERSQTEGLLSNMSTLRNVRTQLETEMGMLKAELEDVKEQMRDLMFFVSAREKIAGDEELAGGDVLASSSSKTTTATGGGGSSKNKKKKSKKPSSGVVAQLAAAQQQLQQRQTSVDAGTGADGKEGEGEGGDATEAGAGPHQDP